MEFKYFYQNITNDIWHLSGDNVYNLETKLHHTCENYSDNKAPYKYQRTIDTLGQNNSIVMLEQDKERGVVMLDKNIYVDKCLPILGTNQFMKLDKNPTSLCESKKPMYVEQKK